MGGSDYTHRPCEGCGGPVTFGSRSGVCRECWTKLRSDPALKTARAKGNLWAVDIKAALGAPQKNRDYSACPHIRTDCAIVSDVHVPYHHVPTLEWLIREARARKIATLLVAGDLIDWRTIARFPKQRPAARAIEEITAAIEVLDLLAKFFKEIVVLKGNHELRLQRLVERACDSRSRDAHILDGFEREELDCQDYRDRYVSVMEHLTKRIKSGLSIKWSGSPTALIDGPKGHKPWRVVHQRNGSILPPSEALKHWQRWTQPIITTHTHLWGMRSSPNGEHLLVNIGCATDERNHEYCNEEPNGYPAWERGFALVIGGRLLPFLEHPYIYHAPA